MFERTGLVCVQLIVQVNIKLQAVRKLPPGFVPIQLILRGIYLEGHHA